jgi:hypothetical protein
MEVQKGLKTADFFEKPEKATLALHMFENVSVPGNESVFLWRSFLGPTCYFCVGDLLGRQDGAENCQTPSGQGLHYGPLLAVLLLDGFGKPLTIW